MHTLEPYLQHLETLTSELSLSNCFASKRVAVEAALNGELSKTLRKVVPAATLQANGAFFTGEAMADGLIADIRNSTIKNTPVYDAACGGGNLLLAYARRLPIKPTLSKTIRQWGEIIQGSDLHEEFVRATRARLVLLAAIRGMDKYGSSFLSKQVIDYKLAFPHISRNNSLTATWPATPIILLNPPFNLAPVAKECRWATGRASQAALFIEKCLLSAPEGTIVKAILPDVLRSGTRYKKWRTLVEAYAEVLSIEVLGQFDPQTNVEVFSITAKVGKALNRKGFNWLLSAPEKQLNLKTIGELCTVQVGRVVPHRDKEEGPEYPYFDVNNLPKWVCVAPSSKRRRFSGATFLPPFVIIRRNSRATDANRATATVVQADEGGTGERIAVENHLIVVKPLSGKLEDAKSLLGILQDPRTNDWLNNHIRCRHLTVSSIQSLPWWK